MKVLQMVASSLDEGVSQAPKKQRNVGDKFQSKKRPKTHPACSPASGKNVGQSDPMLANNDEKAGGLAEMSSIVDSDSEDWLSEASDNDAMHSSGKHQTLSAT